MRPLKARKSNVRFSENAAAHMLMLTCRAAASSRTKPGKHGAPHPRDGFLGYKLVVRYRVTASLGLTSKPYLDQQPQIPKADVWTACSELRLGANSVENSLLRLQIFKKQKTVLH
jgi:hypothetical protein